MHISSQHPISVPLRWIGTAVFALNVVACSGDGATIIDRRELGPASSVDPEDDDAAPLYALVTTAWGPDGQTSYLTTLPSLEAGTVLSLDSAIERPGNWSMLGIDGYPAVWLAHWDGPTIERWDLRDDGTFVLGQTLSFANLGVTQAGRAEFGPLTLERASFPEVATGTLVNWNPTTMEVLASLPLGIPDDGAIPPAPRGAVAMADGTLLVDYFYLDAERRVGDSAGIVAVDWSNNEILGRDEWDGCGMNKPAGQTSDGTAYFTVQADWVHATLLFEPGEPWASPPCIFRVLPGSIRRDPTFAPTDLGDLIGGGITGSLEVLNDNLAYFMAWDEELFAEELTVENYFDRRFSIPAWKWYTWDMRSAEAVEVPNTEPLAAATATIKGDGRKFFADRRLLSDNGGLGISPTYELAPNGTIEPAFIGYGTLSSNIVRLR